MPRMHWVILRTVRFHIPRRSVSTPVSLISFVIVYGWPNGFSFILSFLSPVWTICVWFFTLELLMTGSELNHGATSRYRLFRF